MSKLNLLFAVAAAAGILAGCVKEYDLNPTQGDLIPLNISSNIDQVPVKATASGFVDKDALGLYAVNWINNNTEAGTLVASGNQADNVKYIFDEGNQKWNPVKAVYYKDANTHADLYLYYPFQSTITDVNASNFEVNKDQSKAASASELSGYEASDFLWGKAENVTPSENKVSVVLNHKLSSISVILKEKEEDSGFEPGEFVDLAKSVILSNTSRKGTINFSTGVVTCLGSPQPDGIVLCPQGDDSFRGIAIPQTVNAGELFSMTINGQTYKYSTAEEKTFEAGQAYEFTFSVSKKVPSGEFELELSDLSIVDWTEDKNTHGGEARQYFVVNVTEPGTLGANIKSMGKNPDKIKNLKIVGNVRDDDFYFMRDSMAILEAVNMKESIIGNGIIPNEAFNAKQRLCYFVFPEYVKAIGSSAFGGTTLTGALIIPEDVEMIGPSAFSQTALSSVTFNNKTEKIMDYSFSGCKSLSGRLVLPEALISIGDGAFENCNFSGDLLLPENLETIGRQAFMKAGSFSSGLRLPNKVKSLQLHTFNATRFQGRLDLNNCTQIDEWCFYGCGFSGELVIPEGTIAIPRLGFSQCIFSKIICPESLRTIDEDAFSWNGRLEEIDFKEGLVSIGQNAFAYGSNLLSLHLPSTLQTIGGGAFADCYYLSNITCDAVEPPTVQGDAFNGAAKDNFTVEVPAQSVKRYQAEPGWSDFTRIAAHYDFSVSRERMRTLNAEQTRTYTLRAPANFNWSIQSKPEWVTVSPVSGTGKTDITVTVSAMDRTSETFEVNEGTYNNPSYKNYKGRSGEIIFRLDEDGVDYTCSFGVEQYDSDYSDGQAVEIQKAGTGNGIDIIFVGDGYDAKDIAKETFISNANEGYEAFFNIEPYKTYKDYFNVYTVVSQSDDSGIGTVNTVVDTKFGTYFTQNRIKVPEPEPVFSWAKKANAGIDFTKALVINLLNTSSYEGICAMYSDGSAIAFCPVSRDAYPYDFRGLIQHEAGGHGFGKLGDEYIYHNAFIQNCDCKDGCDHPQGDNDLVSSYGVFKSLGWYKNLSMNGDMYTVPWAHLIYNPKYSNYVDMYEGGYMHSRGMYRSEATSCMNNNIPYYSAISRQAMVERILEISGEGFTLDKFYANDSDEFGPQTKAIGNTVVDRTFGVDPKWNRGSEEGSVVYMGEHPDYSKIK